MMTFPCILASIQRTVEPFPMCPRRLWTGASQTGAFNGSWQTIFDPDGTFNHNMQYGLGVCSFFKKKLLRCMPKLAGAIGRV